MAARRQPGEGSVHKRSRDGMWVGTVDIGWTAEGKRRRKSVTSRTQAGALAKLREIRKQVDSGGTVATTRAPTVGEWLERWMATLDVRPGTMATYRHKVNLITEAIGKVRVDTLTPAHVRAVHLHAAEGRSSTTALHCHRVMSTAMLAAMREGVVQRNVVDLVKAPKQAVSTATSLTALQGWDLLKSVQADPLATRWAAALLYGMRQGEALGLTWDAIGPNGIDIAWQLQGLTFVHGCGGTCRVARAGQCPKRKHVIPAGFEMKQLDGALCLTRPKSTAGRRVVPVTSWFGQMLEARRAVAADEPNPHGLVFARPDGRPISASLDREAWHAALERAGLPQVRLHDARHTAASLLLELGVDTKVITAILGHSDVIVTRGYQHVSQGLMLNALEGLGDILTAAARPIALER